MPNPFAGWKAKNGRYRNEIRGGLISRQSLISSLISDLFDGNSDIPGKLLECPYIFNAPLSHAKYKRANHIFLSYKNKLSSTGYSLLAICFKHFLKRDSFYLPSADVGADEVDDNQYH